MKYGLLILCLHLGGLVFSVSAAGNDCSVAVTAIEQASKLRGLRVLRAVPCKLQNQKEVEQYLRDTLQTKIPPERIQNEGWAFKLLGIIPWDYDYLEGLIRLYTSQLGGYYDPEKNYYAMASWMPAMMQLPIAVHELTHALQDQHYNLDKMVDPRTETSDTLMARSAMIEGDATAVMLDYARSLSGQSPIAKEASISGLMAQNLAGAMLSSSLHSAPQGLQSILMFPYLSGLNFAHALLRRGGYREIDRGFKEVPLSTEQILHPDKYLSRMKDFSEVIDAPLPENFSVQSTQPVFSDRVGEFVISTWLSSWVPALQASRAAAGWGGDKINLYARDAGKAPLLVWTLLWDTPHDTEEFQVTLEEAFGKRFQKKAIRSSSGYSFSETLVGFVEVKVEEQKVVLVIG